MSHLLDTFVRIPALLIRQKLRPLPPMDMLEWDQTHLRVWPQDIDVNFHLNNARYLSLMDYGRVHLGVRTGLLKIAFRERWAPLIGGTIITYRRSLAPWAKCTLSTRTLGWDEKWFYMEQTFHMGEVSLASLSAEESQHATSRTVQAGTVPPGSLAAVAWVRGLYRARTGNVPPQSIVDRIAPGLASPALSKNVLDWNQASRVMLAAHDPRVPNSKDGAGPPHSANATHPPV